MNLSDKKGLAEETGRARIAVLLPCYNEDVTIGKVVRDFKAALPSATIYVFDNNSSDKTAEYATDAGATVVHSNRQGKGNVVRHMFAEVDADIYIMADGDDTYPASSAGELLGEFKVSGADMVVGSRLGDYEGRAFRVFHRFGNHLISKIISILFGKKVIDVLSGYRVFSRLYVKGVHLKSGGFEVETEMTLQALVKNFSIKEIPITYAERPEGSISKLNTFSDGIQIMKAIFLIFKDYKPFLFFSTLSAFFGIMGLVAGWYPVADYLREGYVYHLPLAVLAASLEILAVVFLGTGFILNTITNFHIETQEKFNRVFSEMDKGNNSR